MVPLNSERRHRLNPVEIEPVMDACHHRLIQLLQDRSPEDLLEASILYRVWFRIQTYCTSKPKYPPHDTWKALASNIQTYGTVSREEGAQYS